MFEGTKKGKCSESCAMKRLWLSSKPIVANEGLKPAYPYQRSGKRLQTLYTLSRSRTT
jgi:hypothetical protein